MKHQGNVWAIERQMRCSRISSNVLHLKRDSTPGFRGADGVAHAPIEDGIALARDAD
jgi:hypothetical protein